MAGVLFQQGALFSSLTVVENVALPLIEHAGLSRADAEHLACVKLALAGLPLSAANKYPASLSGGMIKRAALARALALDPDILFLDEPTAGLDPIGAAAFDQLILTLRDALGLSVFLITHDLDTLYTPSPTGSRYWHRNASWWPTPSNGSPKPTTPGFMNTSTAHEAAPPTLRPHRSRRDEMETRAHHVMIGLFSVLVVLSALGFGLWLAKSSVDTAFKDYEVVFNEAVSGLSRGSPVQYSGIKVGDVLQLSLDPKDPRRVLARIRLAGDTPIKEDTSAKLALTGITGTSLIQLSGGTPQSAELKGKDGKLPEIIASPSPISRLLSDSSDLMSSINVLLHNANALFSTENVENVSKTLNNLQQTTGAIASQRDDIRQVLQQMTQVSKQVSGTLEQTSQLMRNANNLLDKQGTQALGSAERAMQSLEQSSATLNKLLANNQDSVNSGLQGLNELGPAIRELRDTLGSLRTVSQRLNANPSGYLLGRDKNKEFTP